MTIGIKKIKNASYVINRGSEAFFAVTEDQLEELKKVISSAGKPIQNSPNAKENK